MQCLSIDLPVYIHINASIIIYLSVYLLTYSSVFVYPKSLATSDSIHPSFIHSFCPSIHPRYLTITYSMNHLPNNPKKKLHRLCMDSWQHNQVKLLDALAPEGLPPSPVSTKKGMDPQHPSTVNRISVNFSSALVLSLP